MTAATLARRASGPPVPVPRENPLTLAVLGRPALAFAVYGKPATQGSKSPKGTKEITTKAGATKRITNLVESANASKVNPMGLTRWRESVAGAALATLPYGWEALDGPLVADLTISLPRGTRVPKFLRTLPMTKPDLDKLLRAIPDALCNTAPKIDPKGRKIIVEDSRIVSYRKLDKVWVGDPFDNDALRSPGAVIRLYRYPADLLGKIEGGMP